jgi:hypothetical protein
MRVCGQHLISVLADLYRRADAGTVYTVLPLDVTEGR